MTTVNLICPICTEDYDSKDEFISTICGHIFHKTCFEDWQTRSSSCPECRVENTKAHTIYLHIEDTAERSSSLTTQGSLEAEISWLKGLLTESESSYRKLHTEKKAEISRLQDKLFREEARNCILEEKLSKLKLDLKESEENVSDLFEHINQRNNNK